MEKYRPKIGDVFEVPLEGEKKGYMQYIANDLTALNMDVVRIFKKRYMNTEKPELRDIVNDDIEFYTHCVAVKFGIEDALWKVIGNTADVGDLKTPFFRDYLDQPKVLPSYKQIPVKVAHMWRVWRINGDMVEVGELRGENIKAEPGLGYWPKHIIARMNTGKYPVHFADYK